MRFPVRTGKLGTLRRVVDEVISDLLLLVLGLVIITSTFGDVFQSVIVPRPATRRMRVSAWVSRTSWKMWRWYGHRMTSNENREDFLGTFAPLLLVGLLVFWVASLILGYGLLFFSLREHMKPVPDFLDAIYFAGTALLTIGFGDFVPTSDLARFLSIAAGASGFGIVAIVTTFLFAIFGAYQRREAFVVSFCNRAGAPPSGVELIETHARLNSIASLVETMRESQHWLAEVLETHLAYPVLTYFRSTHDNISWVGTLGAILDTSTIVLTTIDVPNAAEAAFVNRLARHFLNDFSNYFGFGEGDDVGVDQAEFDFAYDRLHEAGMPLIERAKAWRSFALARSLYASRLNMMAQYWRIPPAQWVGDRSLIPHAPLLRLSDVAAMKR